VTRGSATAEAERGSLDATLSCSVCTRANRQELATRSVEKPARQLGRSIEAAAAPTGDPTKPASAACIMTV